MLKSVHILYKLTVSDEENIKKQYVFYKMYIQFTHHITYYLENKIFGLGSTIGDVFS